MESKKRTPIPEEALEGLKEALPPIIARRQVPHYLGNSISLGHLQNLDCLGDGPKRHLLGRRVVYFREDLLAWLREHLREVGTDE